MAGSIKVSPSQLNTTATQIDSEAAEYRKLYTKLYSEVGAMKAAWQGVDNLAFTNQIEGFRQDFDEMAKLVEQYSQFLKQSAKTYQQAQDNTVAGARRLGN
jgi:WXG100 family type VII secretion target